MGTRADFYRGGINPETMIWLGSIAWDGYPDGIDEVVLKATTETEYAEAALAFMEPRSDYTHPEQGWPWPWEDSNTTDYAYTFADGRVVANCFGHGWFTATDAMPELDVKPTPFPNMKKIQKVDMGPRSGLIIF
jgi:hypothetical protein